MICLQEKTGSCAGCNISGLVREGLIRKGLIQDARVVSKSAKLMEQVLCPEGLRMQIRVLSPSKESVW